VKIYGYVQAGGGSTRFGKDKALVELGGRSLLERTIGAMGGACERVFIVARPGKYMDYAGQTLTDRWPGEGPLGGILTALHHLREGDCVPGNKPGTHEAEVSYALVLSCDLPFLTADWLAELCSRAVSCDAQVVFPESSHGWEPLCACWRTDCLEEVEVAFNGGVRKVTEAMKRIRREVLDESVWKRFDTDGHLFWNMNTPEDYEEAQRIWAERAAKNRQLE